MAIIASFPADISGKMDVSAALDLATGMSNCLINLETAVAGKADLIHSHPESDVTSLITDLNTKITAAYGVTLPTRALNTNFTPSGTSKVIFGFYTVGIQCTATLLGGQSGMIALKSDLLATPTTTRGFAANSNSIALAIAITSVTNQVCVLPFTVLPGYNVRLETTGNAGFTLLAACEVAFG